MRDEQGRFLTGNPGGPGRPKRTTERDYLAVVLSACPPDKWQEIVERAVDDATDGDPQARNWLASYLIGKPSGTAPTVTNLAIAQEIGGDTPEFLKALGDARRDRDFYRLLADG